MSSIYLDHNATTPVRPEVREAMAPFLGDVFGNPSSLHRWGRKAAAALDGARERVAALLGARPTEIYFVRGGTESDNLAILGRAQAARARGEVPRVAASAIEHSAILDALDAVVRSGGEARLIGVDRAGRLSAEDLEQVMALRPHVVSVMWVNNEVGTVLPVPEVAERATATGIAVHTDAVQAVGKLRVRVDETPVDLLTLTGHKIYGPKGTGLLFVRQGTDVCPGLFGGGQERGLRPGTEDVAGAVGLAEAVSRVVEEREKESSRMGALRDALEARLLNAYPDLVVHGGEGTRAPHVSNLGVPGVDANALIQSMDMEGVAVSSGSACHSGAAKTSHVLTAMYGAAAHTASIRFSLGRLSGEPEVKRAAEVATIVIGRLREMAGTVPAS